MGNYVVEIVIAVLALVGTLAGSLLANNKHQAVMGEQLKGVKDDINTLSTRVDKHNNLVERMIAPNKATLLQILKTSGQVFSPDSFSAI